MPVNTGKYRLGPRGQAEIKNRAIERPPNYDVSHVVSGLYFVQFDATVASKLYFCAKPAASSTHQIQASSTVLIGR